MTPEDILRHPARVLTQDQREAYFRDGYLVVERLIPEDVVDEINRITAGWIDRSRAITAPNDVLDVAPGRCEPWLDSTCSTWVCSTRLGVLRKAKHAFKKKSVSDGA